MGASSFCANQIVTLNSERFIFLRKLAGDIWQLQNVKTQRIVERTVDELQRSYVDNALVFHNDAEPVTVLGRTYFEPSPAQLEEAKIRRAYVMAVLGIPTYAPLVTALIDRVWKNLELPGPKPCSRTVFRWKASFLRHGRDILALVRRHDKKGNRSSRHAAQVEAFIDQAIEEVYLNRKKGTIKQTINRAVFLIKRENDQLPVQMHLKIPTKRTVRSRLEKIPAFDKCVAREGYWAARVKFRAVLKHRLTDAPLERAEIDHSLLDVFVVDDINGLPLGRPWITVCIDDNTRCILGIHISFQSPSFLTVSKCLRHAVMPKVNLQEQYPEIEGQWLAHGVMCELVMDNGVEFHSLALESACLGLGIEMYYAPRKTPWYKGKIERVIGTLQKDLVHNISGTTFSNVFERGDYDPQKHAVISLSTLKLAVHKWAVDVYHNTPHRALDGRPIDVWRSRINVDEIRVPDDPTRLDAVLGKPYGNCLLSHKGIEHERLLYNSPELTALRRELGDTLRVEIRVDDADIGKIIVLSPDKSQRMFVVPAVDSAYASGLTLWQHKVIRRYAAEYLNTVDPMRLIEAKQALSELVAAEFVRKKGKGGKRAALLLVEGNKSNQKAASKNKTKREEPTRPTPPQTRPAPAPVENKYDPIVVNRSVDYP